ncbi:MAG: globin [Sandaracinaceae bacterium]|nr:globin [Sandaracinaceae bacterium]MBK7154208.1 globin [Sandaracinaceae bacterium]MBK7776355.1 globin [Sandaracinaceae bacterium]MBK8409177.1 globin [Sandaracinaceae bacterium]MBP7681143.1 globin [Deltaproteobacteria bacterium]
MSAIDPATYTTFENSLFRCAASETFLERFYDIFLKSSDAVAARFAGVDMNRQRSVLRGSLYLVARAAGGFSDGMEHLATIARSHGERGLDIKAEFYDQWLAALVQAAGECDPHFDHVTGAAWETCLRPCIAIMTR